MKSFVFWIGVLVGAFGVKAIEDMVIPRVEAGWNMIDDQRIAYCRQKSQGLLQTITFQRTASYYKCINNEIWLTK